jgi:hypothetical protein
MIICAFENSPSIQSFLVTKIVYAGYGQLIKWLLFLLPFHCCAPWCIFPLITIALTISFTIKRRLFARKEWLVKRNKATLISLCSRGRATSADIGQEFRPLRHKTWVICSFLKAKQSTSLSFKHSDHGDVGIRGKETNIRKIGKKCLNFIFQILL